MSRIRYGSTSGGYRVHNTIMRDPILGLPLEDLSVLMAQSGSDLYLDARKADGFTKGINSPLVNPWVDLTKNGNNATFQNLAGTTSDGWVNVLLPNGKTMPFLKLDGVDTVGIIPNNPSVDIVGLDV